MFTYLRTPVAHCFHGDRRRGDETWDEAFDWCIATFGRQPPGQLRWSAGMFIIEIYGDDDALQFRLRWC